MKKADATNTNWIEINIGGKYYGFYVDDKGNIIRNATVNGVEFDENGLAKDSKKFHMMVVVTETDVPEGSYTYKGKDIEIIQDKRIVIDDNDYKYGIFILNEKGEWEILSYGDFSGGRNPDVRTLAGEYLTAGHFAESKDGNTPYFKLSKDKNDPRKETGIFGYPTIKIKMENGAWADMFHSDKFDSENDFDKIEVDNEDFDGGKDVSNGCTRLPLKDAKYIYEECAEGLYIQVYENKEFDEYSSDAQKDAIKSWANEIENAKNIEDVEKIEAEIRENYGDEAYDLVVKEEKRRKNESVRQLAALDKKKDKKEVKKVKRKK